MSKKKHEPEILELGKFFESIKGETDRGVTLLVASILDQWLFEILNSFLLKDKVSDELLSGFSAPLGTFSSKIKMCYSLALIDKTEYNILEIIRKIRNEFGHNWEDVSFNTPKIKGQSDKLEWYGPNDVEETDRRKFDFASTELLVRLIWRKRYIQKEQIKPRKEGMKGVLNQ